MPPRSVYATPGQIGLGEFGSVPNDQEHGGLTVVMVARTAATSNFMAPGFGYLTVLNGKRGGGKPERGLFFVRAPPSSAGRRFENTSDGLVVKGLTVTTEQQ